MKKPPVGWAADPWSEGGTARPMPQPVLLPPDFGLFQALRVPIWVPIGGLRLMPSRKRTESQVVASEVASEAPDNRTGTRSRPCVLVGEAPRSGSCGGLCRSPE